jgi:galactokinase
VHQALPALWARDFAAFGRLMDASHASLRDDYEVSTPELDAFVAAARDGGALGARLTGAGFGGCAISLVPVDAAATVEGVARRDFAARGFAAPEFYRFRPSAGGEVTR